jgi:hypothetical protein
MTKSSIFTWGLGAVLIAAMVLILAGCSNDGPIAPTTSVVKDFSSGGINGHELTEIMQHYDALRQAGGGTTTFDPHSRTLIGVSDRWQGSAVQGMVTVQDANGAVTSHSAGAVFLLADLVYPITVSVWADGYVNQTIYRTNANIIAVGLERLAVNGGQCMIYGLASPDTGLFGTDTFWQTMAMSTQDACSYSQMSGDPSTNPYTILNIDPWRPIGAVSWLFTRHIVPATISTTFTPEPPSNFNCVGYSYDPLDTPMGVL